MHYVFLVEQASRLFWAGETPTPQEFCFIHYFRLATLLLVCQIVGCVRWRKSIVYYRIIESDAPYWRDTAKIVDYVFLVEQASRLFWAGETPTPQEFCFIHHFRLATLLLLCQLRKSWIISSQLYSKFMEYIHKRKILSLIASIFIENKVKKLVNHGENKATIPLRGSKLQNH
ncbi:hypothetical protein NIES4074_57540 [Cylindrospermum sp. NIES-4074]|nr:hypothetical protein NIES4074_57540 [Cylindrospermum sp. NIES-4074]